MKGKKGKEYEEYREWYGGEYDPEEFTPEAVVFSDPHEALKCLNGDYEPELDVNDESADGIKGTGGNCNGSRTEMTMCDNLLVPFTPEAGFRWAKIPALMQKRILDNVFCVNCRKAVTIVLEKAEMVQKDLILRGKCKTCGGNVCRLVEPEAEL